MVRECAEGGAPAVDRGLVLAFFCRLRGSMRLTLSPIACATLFTNLVVLRLKSI